MIQVRVALSVHHCHMVTKGELLCWLNGIICSRGRKIQIKTSLLTDSVLEPFNCAKSDDLKSDLNGSDSLI